MKKLATAVFALALIVSASSAFAANAVRISQVYTGGQSSSAAYTHDYVELFNSSGLPVDISGWALEYGSATGTWGNTAFAGNIYTFPSGTVIQPCKYLLITGSSGTGGVPLPVAADHVGAFALSATSGKIGLFSIPNPNTACGSEIAGSIVDKVGWGSSNCPEVANIGGVGSLTGEVRKLGGLQDTDNNSNDFTVEGSFAPRNSQSPANLDCLATPATSKSWGSVKNIYR